MLLNSFLVRQRLTCIVSLSFFSDDLDIFGFKLKTRDTDSFIRGDWDQLTILDKCFVSLKTLTVSLQSRSGNDESNGNKE